MRFWRKKKIEEKKPALAKRTKEVRYHKEMVEVGKTTLRLTGDGDEQFLFNVVGTFYQNINQGRDAMMDYSNKVLKMMEPQVGEISVITSLEIAESNLRNIPFGINETSYVDDYLKPTVSVVIKPKKLEIVKTVPHQIEISVAEVVDIDLKEG